MDAKTMEINETSNAADNGRHYQRVFGAIPAAIRNAPLSRLKSLHSTSAKMPDWYANARSIDRRFLKELMDERWRLQGVLDELLGDLQHDINAFAEPLLNEMLQANFTASGAAGELTVQLSVADNIAYVIDTGASRVRQSSLLDAALHNFEEPETHPQAWRNGSGIYRKDRQGKPTLDATIPLPEFAALCRRLDIGAQYQRHLDSFLRPVTASAQKALQRDAVASDQASFKVAAMIALLKGDISHHAFGQLQGVCAGHANLMLYGRPMQSHRLSLMGFRMTGIVLFSAVSEPSWVKKTIDALMPDELKFCTEWSHRLPGISGGEYEKFKLLQAFFANGPQGVKEEYLRSDDIYRQNRLSGSLIAYVPDDPEHPLKEYPSLAAFMKELIGKLRTHDYQSYFSRFVAQNDKGRFFSRVNERLTTFVWHRHEPLNSGPWWRETAIENPDAESVTHCIDTELWVTLFRERRDKLIADARLIAVPTDDEDATTRFKRLSSYLSIGWNIFNFGAMLVPGLGEAMLGVMVAQMLAEVAEGVEDWSKGDKEQASGYFAGVLLNFAQLTLMGAGHVIPGARVVPIKLSPFVEGLKTVEFKGKQCLWNPDLQPYEQPHVLPAGTSADEMGVYDYRGKSLLEIDDKYYELQRNEHGSLHRLRHPTRSDTYQPQLEHNGADYWKTELDQPLEWDKTRLLRRSGALKGISDETLGHALTASGIHEEALRWSHAENEPLPPLLSDTLKRLRTDADAKACANQILLNRIDDEWADLVPRFMTRLPGWPEGKAIEVFERSDFTGASFKEGYADASRAQTLQVSRQELVEGQLPDRVVEFLDEQALGELLGEWLGGDHQARVDLTRRLLGDKVGVSAKVIFDTLYERRERSGNMSVRQLKNDYSLSTSMAEELLRHADPADLQHLSNTRKIPLKLGRQARLAEQSIRLSRAYEGLYMESLAGPDSDRLAFHSLENLPGWPTDLRLEVREYSTSGRLMDSIGPDDAPIRKVLVRGTDGKYEAYDAVEQSLHGKDSLYPSILHALPDHQRIALGFEIHEIARLEKALQANPMARDKFEPLLQHNPPLKQSYDPSVMRLRGGMPGYARQTAGVRDLQVRARSLYPGFTPEQVESLLEGFAEQGGSAHARLSALEAEFNRFNESMRRWMNSPTQSFRFGPAGVGEWNSRQKLYTSLSNCWRRTGPAGPREPGVIMPQTLNLNEPAVRLHLRTLPKLEVNLDHVTRLNLRDAGIEPAQLKFLDQFRQLHSLDLQGNELTALPAVITDMARLTELNLSDNRIVLDPAAVGRLRNMRRLQRLQLSENPLSLGPDISQMANLQILLLDQTGLQSWPDGFFGKPRPRHILLDLRRNPLNRIPDVAPGSYRAELLARTWISREPRWISEQNLNTVRQYIESVGMDPDRAYPPSGPLDSAEWSEGMTEAQWQRRQEIWNAVEDEFGSMPFFDEIRKLTQSADFRAKGLYRRELTDKVWRMIDAMSDNSELRIKLFAEAVAPTECVDAGTQLFNAMGVQVLLHEAYALERADLIEPQLLELARGKSRLDELGAIARQRVAARLQAGEQFRRQDVQGNVTGSIDEVEVHLAYMTDLAERLDLPWQARGMQFRQIAEVTKEMIEAALQRIKALEEGDLLRDQILKQAFWRDWVEGANQEMFDGLQRQVESVTDLQNALQRRTDGAALPAEQMSELEEQIKALCIESGLARDTFGNGRNMTPLEYDQVMIRIDQQRTKLLHTLTQQALDRAGLQRVDIPFTIDPDYLP
jgi:hypothetical protein